MLGIEVTRACNFRCRHCFVDAGGRGRAAGDPSADAVEALIRRAAVCGIDGIGWSGGEPLLRRDLGRLTRFAAALGISTGLATNGYLATAKRLRDLRDAGLRVVQVSLDGPDAERAARYRRGPRGQFERALAALGESVALGLQTYVCSLLAPDTMVEVDEMVALARRLGVTGLRYTMWMPVGRAGSRPYCEADWCDPGLHRFLAAVRRGREAGSLPVLVDCPTGPLPFSRTVCAAGRETAYVTAAGELYPCTALMFPDYQAGNVFEQPLDLLLSEGRMFKVLRERARLPLEGACAGCRIAALCEGGCPGRALAHLRAGGRARRSRSRRPSMPVCFFRLAAQKTDGTELTAATAR